MHSLCLQTTWMQFLIGTVFEVNGSNCVKIFVESLSIVCFCCVGFLLNKGWNLYFHFELLISSIRGSWLGHIWGVDLQGGQSGPDFVWRRDGIGPLRLATSPSSSGPSFVFVTVWWCPQRALFKPLTRPHTLLPVRRFWIINLPG